MPEKHYYVFELYHGKTRVDRFALYTTDETAQRIVSNGEGAVILESIHKYHYTLPRDIRVF